MAALSLCWVPPFIQGALAPENGTWPPNLPCGLEQWAESQSPEKGGLHWVVDLPLYNVLPNWQVGFAHTPTFPSLTLCFMSHYMPDMQSFLHKLL